MKVDRTAKNTAHPENAPTRREVQEEKQPSWKKESDRIATQILRAQAKNRYFYN